MDEVCKAAVDVALQSPFDNSRPHDWRLWQRERKNTERGSDLEPLSHWHEIWYCTQCREIEERDRYSS